MTRPEAVIVQQATLTRGTRGSDARPRKRKRKKKRKKEEREGERVTGKAKTAPRAKFSPSSCLHVDVEIGAKRAKQSWQVDGLLQTPSQGLVAGCMWRGDNGVQGDASVSISHNVIHNASESDQARDGQGRKE